MNRKTRLFPILLGLLFLLLAAYPTVPEKKVKAQGVTGPFLATEILGRPTDHSVTINIVPTESIQVYVEYGTASGVYTAQTATVSPAANSPFEITLDGLSANTQIYYRVRYLQTGATEFSACEEGSFWTQRASGSSFVFDIQGDSHPERVNNQFDSTLYTRAMSNVAADQPDFFIAIGDDFSVDTLSNVNAETVTERYTIQRSYLGLVGAPVFLVNGNHEQASLANLDGTADNVAVWAQNARNAYYPQPAPDGFYTGNSAPVENIGLLRNYYAFTWGDALFVMIDPYWHSPLPVDNVYDGGAVTPTPAPRDLWNNTLGETQYQWFKNTLETSAAKYKFVFAHHVNGTGRGGIELADTYEWGNAAQFAAKRPGWGLPIHQLMAANGVTIFFQGHDHIFARQELDGVIYQSLPEPANPFYTYENADAYLTGDKYPNSGHARVAVSPEQVTVSYVRAFLAADEINGHVNGEVALSYAISDDILTPTPAPGFTGNIILGKPTDSSVAASLLSDVELVTYLEYGTASGAYTGQTAPLTLTAGQPAEVLMNGLQPDTAYFYRLRYQAAGDIPFATDTEHTFHTQRPPDSTFTFTLDADPHNRDTNLNAEIFAVTLNQALADKPDFHIDLGDTFMTEKIAPTSYAEAVPTYREFRPFFGIVGASAPLFLVTGNHDGELGWKLTNSAENLAVWSTKARQAFYPNPVPGAFYSGSAATEPFIGVRDGYYAWTWGDALFIALDPYWYSTVKPATLAANWNYTLGEAQYQWLKQTLETSDAKFKFVFAHNLVGGQDTNMRGGIEAADKFEWGGLNADGAWGLSANRPGWPASIHQLLVQNHVTIFFHGHDHLFVKQDLDGVVYQEVPQPSFIQYNQTASAVEYGYTNGDILGCCGYMRIKVSPSVATVDYVRSYRPQDETAARWSGQVSYTYTVNAPDFAPSDLSLSASVLAENNPVGATIGALAATDIELNDTFTYALVDGTGGEDNAAFSLTGNTLSSAVRFDYETKSSYSLRARVTDHRGLSFEKVFTVTVTDANDAPTDLSLSNNTVAENQPIGAAVGALTATDPDSGNTHTYAFTCATPGADDASFQIVGNNLQTNAIFDYETKNTYNVCLRAEDGNGGALDKDFTILVGNLIEAASATFISTGAQDGWILETSEKTSMGGALNYKATTFRLGDDAAKKQYRSILSFDTSTLPENATVTKVTLQIKRFSATGGATFAMFQGLMADVKKDYFGVNGNLASADFQAALGATGKTYGPISPPLVNGWYSVDLTAGKTYIALSSLTQIRLRFKLDDNNNTVANYISFYSGNAVTLANRPQLIIQYSAP